MDSQLHIGISSENLLFLMVNLSTQPELEVSVAGGGLSWKYGDFVTCKENEGNEERVSFVNASLLSPKCPFNGYYSVESGVWHDLLIT